MSRILICATQVPFVRGGAEYLVESLRDELHCRGHTVDVVALPFQWHPVERIVDSALAWRLLDISHVNGEPIDLVIATKFPSYLIRHPR
ncbi:MAG: glycosyl transferase family 1, partial [Chloroflexus aggregans]